MPTTNLGLPLIAGNLTADVVRDMNALAEAVDAKVPPKESLEGLAKDADLQEVDGKLTTHLADMSAHGLDNYAKKTQEAWKTAVLQNGWSGTIQYRKNDLGQVLLQISATAGTIAPGTVIATVPVGYRAYSNKISLFNNAINSFVADLSLGTLGTLSIASSGLVQGTTYYAEMIYNGI